MCLVEQCLCCDTLTVKQPSASINPDNQAFESKGVLSKGNLLIVVTLVPLVLIQSINLYN